MSQEIDKRQGMPQTPPEMVVKPDNGGMCGLSQFISIIGIAAIIAGVCLGVKALDSYSMQGLAPVYIAGGILSGFFNFALAVIVDACQKYRDAHKG